MARRHYNLPPLTSLAAFETAARHRSFKDAAQELNVTPGAVSHQIKALESDLGTALFVRQHRGVDLTRQGKLLYGVLETSFIQISETLSRVRQAHRKKAVVVSTTTAMSALWLTPRLTQFWRDHGHIAVNQSISDTPTTRAAQVDLQIRYGDAPGVSGTRHPLFRDKLAPLCSPDFAKRHPEPNLEQLARLPLIHHVSDELSWTTWEQWFAELGYTGPIADGIDVNNYTIALQAARDGIGVVLGWRRLVKPMTEDGALVPLGRHQTRAGRSFYIIAAPDEFLPDNARTLRDWLVARG